MEATTRLPVEVVEDLSAPGLSSGNKKTAAGALCVTDRIAGIAVTAGAALVQRCIHRKHAILRSTERSAWTLEQKEWCLGHGKRTGLQLMLSPGKVSLAMLEFNGAALTVFIDSVSQFEAVNRAKHAIEI